MTRAKRKRLKFPLVCWFKGRVVDCTNAVLHSRHCFVSRDGLAGSVSSDETTRLGLIIGVAIFPGLWRSQLHVLWEP